MSKPVRPFAAIVGGSKVSSKIGVIEKLLEKCDKLVLGGGMIFTFYKAQGKKVGASLVEEDKVELAKTLMAAAKAKGVKLLLPSDVVVADKFAADAATKIVSVDAIPDGWMGLDIGPASIKAFQDELNECKTVIWNGPMGVFEMPAVRAARGARLQRRPLHVVASAPLTPLLPAQCTPHTPTTTPSSPRARCVGRHDGEG